jgi:hypothetical protein
MAMKPFKKYVLWAILIQVLLCAFLIITMNKFLTPEGMSPSTYILLYLYYPVLIALAYIAGPGESSMFSVPLIGIPLGIILYSYLIAFIIWGFKRWIK